MEQIEAPHEQSPVERREPLFLAAFGALVRFASVALLVFISLAYWMRCDVWAAVTLYPVWCWAGLGVLLVLAAFGRRRWQMGLVLVALWGVFLFAAADTPESVLRGLLPEPAAGELRVLTLNTAGLGEPLENIVAYKPDIVLVQESASADYLDAVAQKLYGDEAHVVRGGDPSILTRGDVMSFATPDTSNGTFVHARVMIDGRAINVISLRLHYCPVRIDLWSRDCWEYYRANRERRRQQVERIADFMRTLPEDEPLIVGGDFNCPPGDAVLWLLQPRLTDAFMVAGRGWGATIIDLAGVAIIRIDQIWTSRQLTATNVFAAPALPSDHRLVVADFLVE